MSDRSDDFAEVLSRSSLGTPEARRMISSVPADRLERIAAKVQALRGELGELGELAPWQVDVLNHVLSGEVPRG